MLLQIYPDAAHNLHSVRPHFYLSMENFLDSCFQVHDTLKMYFPNKTFHFTQEASLDAKRRSRRRAAAHHGVAGIASASSTIMDEDDSAIDEDL